MSNINTLLSQRMKKSEQTSSKMAEMAKQSAKGNLTSFAGVFSVTELTQNERSSIEEILTHHTNGKQNIADDLEALILITSEVKAINNQAAMLHGERIKKAQIILTRYKDGAFTSWLIASYGNRQTPYNLMQYYEFHESLPKTLKPQIELMPRQAIYTLASREGPLEKKHWFVETYDGQTKNELLALIREAFPLAKKDKRAQNIGEATIQVLRKLYHSMEDCRLGLTKTQKNEICDLLGSLQELVDQ